jgi:hypothetical protein
MANTPPLGNIVGAGAPVGSGYPIFVSQDSAGTLVTPHGQYVWNPNAGTNGLWIPAPVDANGNPQVSLAGSSVTNPGDSLTSAGGLRAVTQSEMFNGSTWDQQRNNTAGTLLPSAARTATTSSTQQTNYNARGVIVTLNVTAASGTGGLTLRIQGVEPVTGNVYSINNAPTAVTTPGLSAYVVYPGATASGSVAQVTGGVPLPRTWQVTVYVGDSSSYTYSVGYSLVL